MRKFVNLCILTLFINTTFAQHPLHYSPSNQDLPLWVQLMYSSNPDIGAVVEEHDRYYKVHPPEKNSHTQFYKRWLHQISRDPYGILPGQALSAATQDNLQKYLHHSKQQNLRCAPASSWQCIGPVDFDRESVSRSYAPGAAHVYTVEACKYNPDLIYAGTATAGLWKSADKGLTWTGLTLDMPVNEVYAIEADHSNDTVIYMAEGQQILKSNDGGTTFFVTGSVVFQSTPHFTRDIIMSPADNQILLAACDNGLFRTIDGGLDWIQIMAGSWQEIEWHTFDSSTVYAVKQTGVVTEFYKSTDGGLTFVQKLNGWPVAVAPDENKRAEIAVTPAAPGIVYAFLTGEANGGSGLYGIYVSHDAGESWTFQCCGPGPGGVPNATTNKNLCAWADDGSDDGGQYYYDLALAVSPVDSNLLHVGAVNHWVSNDGGVTFTCPSKWSHGGKVNYVHADIHDINYFGNDLWMACDGGVFYSQTAGDTIERRQYGIAGTDFWGYASGFWQGSDVMAGGTYHNGTLIKDDSVYVNGWVCSMGGDNILGNVNYGDERVIFTDYGKHRLSGDRTIGFTPLTCGMLPSSSYVIGADAEMEYDPACYNIIYLGNGSELWKSTDGGANYTMLHDFISGNVTSIEIGPDRQTIYAVHYPGWWSNKELWKSVDGGITWTNITPPPAMFNLNSLSAPFDIAVGDDANHIWLVRTQQSSTYNNLDGYKVFKSTNGGVTWQNISSPMLDGEYPTNIVYAKGSNGGVYLGTRRAVYYRNNSMSDWQLFNAGLPAICSSTQLQINYKEGKLRNATNRSVYECDLFENNFSPSVQISVDKTSSNCLRDTFCFSDHSSMFDSTVSWNWNFPGGNPSTSTLRNPKVYYTSPGTYDVTLTVTNCYGSNTQTLTGFISTADSCNTDSIPGLAIELNGVDGSVAIPPLNLQSNNLTFSAWVRPNGQQNDWAGIIFNRGATANGISVKNNYEVRYHWDNSNWSWSSGLYVIPNEWNHVALVVTPASATIYVNGTGVTHLATHNIQAFDGSTMIGADDNGGSRYFKGIIDEVCIYNQGLTQNEIREQMHLTKNSGLSSGLISYYQFNESAGPVLDKINQNHALPSASAVRVTSTGPFGGGNSFRTQIISPGNVVFGNTGLAVDFASVNPSGELVATRINLSPDVIPNNQPASRSYWVVDNYGINVNIGTPLSMTFDQAGYVDATDAVNPAVFKLYHRSWNADGNTWGVKKDDADAAAPGTDGSVSFSTGNTVTQLGQFILTNEGGNSFNTGIHGLTPSSNQDILAYPTHVNQGQSLNILTSVSGDFTVTIYTTDGRKVQQLPFRHKVSVSTDLLAPGIYLYQVKSRHVMQNGKFVIE